MIKFGAMAIHISALKFVSFQLKKNIPYTVCIVITLTLSIIVVILHHVRVDLNNFDAYSTNSFTL